MRRNDREVTDAVRIHEIIKACSCIHLALHAGEFPYIVPLSFGYEEQDGKRIFYMHSASEGRKIELLKANPRVGFELECGNTVRTGELGCEATTSFSCVIGTGRVCFLDDVEAKIQALRQIMKQNTGREDWAFAPEMVRRVTVLRLEVEELSCKVHE